MSPLRLALAIRDADGDTLAQADGDLRDAARRRGRAGAVVTDRRARCGRLGKMGGECCDGQGADVVTVEELVVEFAMTRLDNPELDLEEVAAVLVHRAGRDLALEFASRNLAVRGELRGGAFESAVEYVVRTILMLRDDAGD
jgi:hypothetical protein